MWLELVVQPTASLVFEADPALPDLMRRPPRPRSAALFSRREFVRPLLLGTTLSAVVLAL